MMEQIIKCKIKGLRFVAFKNHLERKNREKTVLDDGSVLIKITGCKYKISGERLGDVLSHWGVISSRIKEATFNDPHDE